MIKQTEQRDEARISQESDYNKNPKQREKKPLVSLFSQSDYDYIHMQKHKPLHPGAASHHHHHHRYNFRPHSGSPTPRTLYCGRSWKSELLCPLTAQDRMWGRVAQQTPCNSQFFLQKPGVREYPRSPGLTMHAETWVRSQQTGSQSSPGEAFTCPRNTKPKALTNST